MSFEIEHYAKLRPFLYHLTARQNLAGIRALKRLDSAATTLAAAARHDLLRCKRHDHEIVSVGKRSILLRDQAPLYVGNADLGDEWTFEDLIEHLNKRVFFWSGTEDGPIAYGRRHFERYAHEQPLIFRVRFDSLMRSNPGRTPLFCPYNSGAPRCSYGRKAPRGPDTFLSAEYFRGTAVRAAEVTFLDHVQLPRDAEISTTPDGSWRPWLADR